MLNSIATAAVAPGASRRLRICAASAIAKAAIAASGNVYGVYWKPSKSDSSQSSSHRTSCPSP